MSLTKVSYSMIQGAPANALDFGAKGDGTTDDTDALQDFFDYVSSNHIAGIIPSGNYVVSSTLTVTSATTISNFAILGEVEDSIWQTNAAVGVRFLWIGSSGGTVISFNNVRSATISGIFIAPKTTQNIGVCLSIDGVNSTGVQASIGSAPGSGVVQTGILLAYTATSGCDLHRLYNLQFSGLTNGVYIYNSQSKFNVIEKSDITFCTNGINVNSGSFTGYDLNLGHNTVDVLLQDNTDEINIYAPQSELSARFLQCTKETSAAYVVNIWGGRLQTSSADLAADKRYISFKSGGPVNLYGVDFASGGYISDWRIFVDSSPAYTDTNAQLNAYGCVFPNNVVYEQPGTTVATLIGCGGVVAGGSKKPIPNKLDASTYNTTAGLVIAPAVTQLAANAATIDASVGGDFITQANSGVTAISAINNGIKGQTITIAGGSSTNATTIADSGVFKINGAITLNANTTIILKTYDGTNWLEMSRSVN